MERTVIGNVVSVAGVGPGRLHHGEVFGRHLDRRDGPRILVDADPVRDAPFASPPLQPVDVPPEGQSWRAFTIISEKGVIGLCMGRIACQVDHRVVDDVLVLVLKFAVPADRPITKFCRKAFGNAMFVNRIGMVGGEHQLAIVPVNPAGVPQQAGADLVPVFFGLEELEQFGVWRCVGHWTSPEQFVRR